MYSKSDSMEIMINDKANEVIKELFQSLLLRYQIGLQTSMKGSNLIFNFVYLLYYKCHKINLGCCKIEHRNDVICRKIMDSARSKKVQF